MTERFDVFVVCAADDRAWVDGFLLNGLRAAGVRCGDETQFELGRPLPRQFVEAVERSDRVLLVVSPAFLADQRAEWVQLLATQYGQEHSTWPVVPLLLRPVDRLPLDLSLLTRLDATDESRWEPCLARLVADLDREIVDPDAAPECPYPGLEPFTSERSRDFHGRTAETDQVCREIGRHPVLAVIGTSGSGKSSLLHAGVGPRLAADGFVVVTFRPGRDPELRLRAALASVPAASPGTPEPPVLLVVDQLEEVFTLAGAPATPADRSARVAAFCAALEQVWSGGRVRCVVAIRADYYPQLMTSPLWAHVRAHRLELLPLGGDGLRQAVVAPAARVGVHVEAALVERVVRDAAGEPGSLPLVQETLVLLWGRLTRRFLPTSAYDTLILPGRSYGEPPRTGLQVALARHADATMAVLGDADRLVARRILLRLVQLLDGREDVRRQQRRSDLASDDDDPAALDRVLGHLVASRLVTATAAESTSDPGETLVDLSHEALISGWPALRDWIADRRAAERFRRGLEEHADDWVRRGRGPGGRLDEVELAEAEAWLSGPDAGELGASADVRALVTDSRAALDAAARRKVRLDRLFRVLTAALAVLLVAVVVAAILAVRQRDDAEERRVLARSGELGQAARALPVEQLDRALLLAREGLSLRSTPGALGGMLAALSSGPRAEHVLAVESPQYAVAVGPGGGVAVTGGLDGVVRVWDLVSRRPGRPLAQLGGEVRSVALSPDGTAVAATSSTGDVGQWSVPSGTRLPTASAGSDPNTTHRGSVRAVAYSPDGTLLATAGQDGLVIVREARSGRARHVLTGYRDWLDALAFTPDGTTLVAAGGRTEGRSTDRRILLWDVDSGRLRAQLPGHPDAVRALAVDPTGSVLASAGAEGTVRLWSLPGGRLQRTIAAHDGRIFGLAFSPDGSRIATAGRDHTVRVWDRATGRAALPALRGHGASVRGVAFAGPDRLVSVGNDPRVFVWDVRPLEPARLATFLTDRVTPSRAVALDPGRDLVASGDDDGIVTLRRTSDGVPTGVTLDVGAPVSGVAFGPAGQLVTATFAGRVQLWDAGTGTPRSAAVEAGQGSLVVAVSPDGRFVSTGGDEDVVTIWDAGLTRRLATLTGHLNWVRGLAFRGDSALVSVGADGMAYVWTGLPDARRVALNLRSSPMESVAISPDGRRVATGNTEGQVIVWDADRTDARGVDRPTLTGHDGAVRGVAFDPGGRWVVTTDASGTVRLWGPDPSFDPWGTLGRVRSVSDVVAISSTEVLTVGSDGPARWTLDARDWSRIACDVAGRDLDENEAQQYGFATPPRTCPARPDG